MACAWKARMHARSGGWAPNSASAHDNVSASARDSASTHLRNWHYVHDRFSLAPSSDLKFCVTTWLRLGLGCDMIFM